MDPTNEQIASSINALIHRAHINAISKGWWTERLKLMEVSERAGMKEFGVKAVKSQLIALAASELSEALEGLRKDMMDDHLPHHTMETAELADVIIRCFDHAAAFDLPLAQAILEKMAVNESRSHKHGGKAF